MIQLSVMTTHRHLVSFEISQCIRDICTEGTDMTQNLWETRDLLEESLQAYQMALGACVWATGQPPIQLLALISLMKKLMTEDQLYLSVQRT